jgi:hypothetical protein
MELVSHAALGELAAAVTGASWVQVWWVQLVRRDNQSGIPGKVRRYSAEDTWVT